MSPYYLVKKGNIKLIVNIKNWVLKVKKLILILMKKDNKNNKRKKWFESMMYYAIYSIIKRNKYKW